VACGSFHKYVREQKSCFLWTLLGTQTWSLNTQAKHNILNSETSNLLDKANKLRTAKQSSYSASLSVLCLAHRLHGEYFFTNLSFELRAIGCITGQHARILLNSTSEIGGV